MKFNIYKTSDYDFKQTKTFETIEELIEFKKQVRYPLIIVTDYVNGSNSFAIEIYDDYRE
jgi:hypothetical protein